MIKMEFYSQERIEDKWLYWLAGFIDGEGCFNIYCYIDKRSKRPSLNIRPFLSILQAKKNKKAIDFVATILKRNKIKYNRYDYKRVSDIRIIHKNLKEFIKLILPYLKLKKEIAKHSLKFWEIKRRTRVNNNQYSKKPSYSVNWVNISKFCKWVDNFNKINQSQKERIWNGKRIKEFYKEIIKKYEEKQ